MSKTPAENLVSRSFHSFSFYHSKKFIITLIIISFSSGFDSANSKVIATKVLSEIIFSSPLNNKLFLLRKYRKILAAILLHPSIKGWSLTIK